MTNYKTPIPKGVQDYITDVLEGKINACKEQKQLCEYVQNVFRSEELEVDETRVEKYLSYQKYFIFKLFHWEIFLLILMLCVFRKDGLPRWNELFALCGRGTGKNGFISFLVFCLISPANGIQHYDVCIVANSEHQAKTSFEDVRSVMEGQHSSKLRKFFKWTKELITCKQTQSNLEFFSNNPKNRDGLRPGAVIYDEVHQYENWDNINVFGTALGKVEHPRTFMITTNGEVRDCVLDQLLKKSKQILNGEIADNGFLPFICQLDEDEEVHSPELWEKANPSLPYLPNLMEQLVKEYENYKLDPVTNTSFMSKRMNRPQTRVDTAVTSWENILATNKEVPDLTGKSCVVGIDFAKTTDFVSVFLLFKEENYYGIHHSWFCTNSNDKSRIKIPLEEMVQRGHLTMVDDVEVSPSLITDWLYEQSLIYNIEKIAIDSFRYSLLARSLKEIGFDAKEKQVKLVRPSDIMLVYPKINSIFVSQKLSIGDDALFRWFTNNTKLEPAPNGNYKYGKIEPKSRKTDGFMAYVAAMTIEEELPEIQDLTFFSPIIF